MYRHPPPLIFLRGGGVCIQYRLLRGRGSGAMVRLVNFVPEARLMYKNIKTLPETGINDSFEEMEPEFSVWNILSGRRGLPFQMYLPRYLPIKIDGIGKI